MHGAEPSTEPPSLPSSPGASHRCIRTCSLAVASVTHCVSTAGEGTSKASMAAWLAQLSCSPDRVHFPPCLSSSLMNMREHENIDMSSSDGQYDSLSQFTLQASPESTFSSPFSCGRSKPKATGLRALSRQVLGFLITFARRTRWQRHDMAMKFTAFGHLRVAGKLLAGGPANARPRPHEFIIVPRDVSAGEARRIRVIQHAERWSCRRTGAVQPCRNWRWHHTGRCFAASSLP